MRRKIEHYNSDGLLKTFTAAGAFPFDVITVDPTDTDADHSTIAAAIAAASGGDVILCGPGVYSENIDINKNITVMAFDLARTTISASTSETVDMSAANGRLIGFKVVNTGTGAFHAVIQVDADNCLIENCLLLDDAGVATEKTGIYHVSGAVLVVKDTLVQIDASTTSSGYHGGIAATQSALLIDSRLDGATYDLKCANANCTVELTNTQFENNTIQFNSGTLQGSALDNQGRDAGAVIQNTSGAAANKYDVGYIDEAGEYQTTTTAQDNVAWHVVTIGGSSDNGFVFAKNRGNATVNYTGSAPSAGDFLVTSTTAGDAQAQATMRPEIFAVCLAAGAGGTVETLLLTNTVFVPLVSTNSIWEVNGHSDTDFVATINGAPTTTSVVYNAPSAGSEDVINVASSSQLAKMRLHNTTRSNYRLISSVNTGTNTITTIASTDDWADTDTIDIESVTAIVGAGAYQNIDMDLSQQTEIPVLARSIMLEILKEDSGGTTFSVFQPFVANDANKSVGIETPAAGVRAYRTIEVPLISRAFVYRSSATGSGTVSLDIMKLMGAWIAEP